MTWHLTRWQDRLVVTVSRRLCAVSDRRPFLAALRKLLPKRPVTKSELSVALDAALKMETTGWKDGEGIIPKIRLLMSGAEASAIYSRSCAVEVPVKRVVLSPQDLTKAVEEYKRTLADRPIPIAERGDDIDRRANLARSPATPPVRKRLRASEARIEPSPNPRDDATASDNPWSAPSLSTRWVSRRRIPVFLR